MAEYIEREKVYHKLTGVCDGYCHGKMCKYTEYMLEEIEDIPTADVKSVRRGKWVDSKCSICGERPDNYMSGNVWIKHFPSYCPNCGADMQSDDNDK